MTVKVDKELVMYYLENNKDTMTLEEITSFAGLFKTYKMIDEAIEGDYKKNKKEVLRYENSIYNINDKVLSNKERIDLEFKRLTNKINNRIDLSEDEKDKLIKQLCVLIDMSENEKYYEYIKKEISIIQAQLGLDNTFLSSAYEVFLEKYQEIYEKINNNDQKYEFNFLKRK